MLGRTEIAGTFLLLFSSRGAADEYFARRVWCKKKGGEMMRGKGFGSKKRANWHVFPGKEELGNREVSTERITHSLVLLVKLPRLKNSSG